MGHKLLRRLRAVVKGGAVHLSAYKNRLGAQAPEPFRALRVLRREEPDFGFGPDGPEYFQGLSWRDAELISGAPPADAGSKLTFTDSDVSVGGVYAYWMAAAEGEPIGPVPVKVRDPEVWWSCERVADELRALARDFPDRVAVEVAGRSVRGREVHGLRVGPSRPAVGLVGAVHAGESGAELMLPAIRRLLAERPELLDAAGVAAIPVLNVDERERLVRGVPWYLRTNANGVDLNRNFPTDWAEVSYGYGLDSSDPDSITYRGPRPASEPETRAAVDFLERHPVDVLYSFHCLASICGGRFLGPARAKEDAEYATKCETLATAYSRGFPPGASEDAGTALSFGTTSGSLPAWMHESGVPAFDLEISADREAEALAQCRADRTDRALLREYRDRHCRGLASVLETLASSSE